jgi:hypothetical protein
MSSQDEVKASRHHKGAAPARPESSQQKLKRRGGNPRYEPTQEARQVVELMTAHGIPQIEIAAAIVPKCDPKTLRRAFAEEIARARPRYKGLIAQSARLHLVGRPAEFNARGDLVRAEVKPSVAMSIFQQKVVLGFRDGALDLAYRDALPFITAEMVACLPPERRQQLDEILEIIAAHAASEVNAVDDPEAARYATLITGPEVTK